MSLTIHDLRVSLRDKSKLIDDLEKKLTFCKSELVGKDKILKENELIINQKNEIISMKDLIIKEKDTYILKLERELQNLKQELDKLKEESNTSKTNALNASLNDALLNLNYSYSSSNNNLNKSTSTSITNSTDSTNSSLIKNTLLKKDLYSSYSNLLASNNNLNANDFSNLTSTSKLKRIAISGESAQNRFNKNKEKISLKEYHKSQDTAEFLTNSIYENDFLKNLEFDQIESIVTCMYPVEFPKDSLIIKEGDIGNIVYIIEEGKVEVTKNSKLLCTMTSGKVFGELAILYNCTRTASIKALTRCKLWAIDRATFQVIMMRFGIEKHEEYMELLKNVPNFQGIREDILTKFVDKIDECNYNNEGFIIRQYAKGDTFYIISKGRAKVTKSTSKWDEPKFVKHLNRGDYFGENALLGEETRPFNVIVDDPNGVTCLVLDRQYYNQLLSDPEMNIKRQESIKLYKRAQTQLLTVEDDEELDLVGIRLAEFEILGTLGLGGFGRVELVRNTRDMRTYALKILKKQHIVETKQQDHVLNERNIMLEARSNFICRLYKTFKDRKYLYLLLEVCLGGELWSLLREKRCFEEYETKFYTACVIEAFSYLHSKGIVYRDLKPENLILDAKGYCKLVDFGFAKRVGLGKKTWTFCGTPEYVAPEIILNKGHDIGADYWSVGILIFELLSGNPPFSGNDPMSTYNLILKGIEAVDFPRKIPKIAGSLIKRLCRENAVDRLGYQRGGIKDVQKHRWFEGFSWENLRNGTLEAPYIPKVIDNTDLSNFDKYPEENEAEPEDDLSGWDFSF